MEDTGYIGSPERVRVLDGVPEALRLLAKAGYERIVVTNQSGVARGMFGERDVELVHAELQRRLQAEGAAIEAFYYCSHLEGCDCRKPDLGLLRRAVAERGLELSRCVVFGDREGDLALARNAGLPGILVNPIAPYAGPEPLFRAQNLLEGVRFWLSLPEANPAPIAPAGEAPLPR